MIKRSLQKIIEKKLGSQKAVIILGARQTGKTTLLKSIFEKLDEALWLNADEPDIQALFETSTSSRFKALFAGYSTIVLDEAQRIKDVGIKLKLIIDQIPELQLIATGSSAFELANQTNEPLTGRKWEFQLYPFAFEELIKHRNEIEEISLLPKAAPA